MDGFLLRRGKVHCCFVIVDYVHCRVQSFLQVPCSLGGKSEILSVGSGWWL
jgi:hypothetical protein